MGASDAARGDDPSTVEGMPALAWLFAETDGANDMGLHHAILSAFTERNPLARIAEALRPYLLPK